MLAARAWRLLRGRARHGAVQCRLSRRRAASTKASRAISTPRTGRRRARLPRRSARARRAQAVQRHARPRLGQAAHQPQQCGERVVGPDAARTAAASTIIAAWSPHRSARDCELLRRAGIEPAKVGAVAPRLLPLVIGSPDWLFNNVFLKAWKIDAQARSSMADDLAAGRKTEVDYINGELVRPGRAARREGAGQPRDRRARALRPKPAPKPWAPAALRREVPRPLAEGASGSGDRASSSGAGASDALRLRPAVKPDDGDDEDDQADEHHRRIGLDQREQLALSVDRPSPHRPQRRHRRRPSGFRRRSGRSPCSTPMRSAKSGLRARRPLFVEPAEQRARTG